MSEKRRVLKATRLENKSSKTARAGGAKAFKEALVRAARGALDAYRALPRRMRTMSLAEAAAPLKTVAFTCNNFPTVLVSVSTHAGSAVLQPDGNFRLPAGAHNIAWAAQGTAGAPFQVTVTGGTLNMPIGGTLPAGGNGGPRVLRVN